MIERGTSTEAPARHSPGEWDEIATTLNALGIRLVAPVHRSARRLTPEALFRRLLLTEDPRLQEALVILLLTHPRFAGAVQRAILTLSGDKAERGKHRYVAAAALQRLWRDRIALSLGPKRAIPPAYVEELGLPALDVDAGEPTLRALARRESERWGYDGAASYASLIELFLTEIRLPGWGQIAADARRDDTRPD